MSFDLRSRNDFFPETHFEVSIFYRRAETPARGSHGEFEGSEKQLGALGAIGRY